MKNILTLIILFLTVAEVKGQFSKTRRFRWEEQVCSSTYIFDTAGYFFSTFACEGGNTISVGRYSVDKNRITIKYSNVSDIFPLIVLDSTPKYSDKSVQFTFVDRFNRPLDGNNLDIDVISKNGKFFKEITLDSAGSITVDPFESSTLRINTLHYFLGKTLTMPIGKSNTRLRIMLPRELIGRYFPKEFHTTMEVLEIKNNKLISKHLDGPLIELE